MSRMVLTYVGNGSREVVGYPNDYPTACTMAEQHGENGTYTFGEDGSRYVNHIEVWYGRAKGHLI